VKSHHTPHPTDPTAGPERLPGAVPRQRPIALARVQALLPLLEFRRRHGLPGPAPLALGDTLPIVAGGRIWERTALEADDPGIGLRVGARGLPFDVPLVRHVRAAPTLGIALATMARSSSRYCTGQQMSVVPVGGRVWLRRRFPALVREGRRQANDFALSMSIALVRHVAGPDWLPDELHVEGRCPPHHEELAGLSRGGVRFGAAADGLAIPRELLELPLRPPSASDAAAEPVPRDDFVDSARRAVRFLVAQGRATLPDLAEVADSSVRSLQRRLAEAGVGFGELVDEARFEAARRLLGLPGVRVTDVAQELGYTDSANFTRAFRRWSGVAPTAFLRAGAK